MVKTMTPALSIVKARVGLEKTDDLTKERLLKILEKINFRALGVPTELYDALTGSDSIDDLFEQSELRDYDLHQFLETTSDNARAHQTFTWTAIHLDKHVIFMFSKFKSIDEFVKALNSEEKLGQARAWIEKLGNKAGVEK
jgi:hypothetical protein